MSSKKPDAWKASLEPLADLVAAPLTYLWSDERTDEELDAMERAASVATQTNCWWATYRAARLVQDEISRIREHRIEQARRDTDEATS